jgi:CelD/BcsL family acetyltransferase involved in cellulose biosynthesis
MVRRPLSFPEGNTVSDGSVQREGIAFTDVGLLPRDATRKLSAAVDSAPSRTESIANATSTIPDGPHTEIAATLAEVDALGPQWVHLDAQMTAPLFFQSFGWCRFLVQFHSQYQTPKRPFAPRIITLWHGPQLQAVWPLQLRQSRGHALLVDLGDPVNQYGGAVIARDADPAAAAERLLAAARTIANADGLLLRKAHVGSSLAVALATIGLKAGEGEAAPFITLRGHANFEAFYKTLSSRTRRNVRQRRDKFEAAGKIEHHVCWGASEVMEALRLAMKLKQDWLDDNGLTSAAFSDPTFLPMVEALARGAATGVELIAMVLSIDGQPASIHWGFVSNKRYYLFMTARNQAFDQHAPGKLHIDYALKDCFALGLEVYDLLAPAAPYKLDWTKRVDQIQDYAVPFTWRGRLVLDGWQRRLRPAAKRTFLRLPIALRQGLARGLRR